MVNTYIYKERFKIKVHSIYDSKNKNEGYMAVVRGILGIALYTTSIHKEYDRAMAEVEWWVDHVIDTVNSKEYKGM